ncbi:hypothetical protein GCM10020000_19880 [Streptomyces olivoverticillatus]
MVVCGDDGLVHRLAAELSGVYGERVTLVLPPARDDRRRSVSAAQGRAAALFGRVTGAVGRGGPAAGQNGTAPGPLVSIVEAAEPDDEALAAAGIDRAAALALVYDDDETNIHAALRARRVNPRLRLVIRLYNRRLGQYLEQLLDQAALVGAADGPDGARAAADASTTVLSDADTAAPALVAAAVAGTSKVVEAGGLLLRAAERPPPPDGAAPRARHLHPRPALRRRRAGTPPGRAHGGPGGGPRPPGPGNRPLLRAPRGRPPGSRSRAACRWAPSSPGGCAGPWPGWPPRSAGWRWRRGWSRGTIRCTPRTSRCSTSSPSTTRRSGSRWAARSSNCCPASWACSCCPCWWPPPWRGSAPSAPPPHCRGRRGVCRGTWCCSASARWGARVLARLRELNIPVVCVERDPQARGVALARSLRVPTVIGDVTEEGVLEAAKIADSRTLLALTSSDTTNLEAVLYARAVKPDVRVVMRLYEDRFANAVYRTLRDSQPQASTRSRSVSYLVAPAFAGAMMGRQILGAVPVERKVILFASVEVADHGALEGRTAAEAFRPGAWRVLALDLDSGPGLLWPLPAEHVFGREDRVIVVATREGLADLLGRRPRPRTADGERPFGAAR